MLIIKRKRFIPFHSNTTQEKFLHTTVLNCLVTTIQTFHEEKKNFLNNQNIVNLIDIAHVPFNSRQMHLTLYNRISLPTKNSLFGVNLLWVERETCLSLPPLPGWKKKIRQTRVHFMDHRIIVNTTLVLVILRSYPCPRCLFLANNHHQLSIVSKKLDGPVSPHKYFYTSTEWSDGWNKQLFFFSFCEI